IEAMLVSPNFLFKLEPAPSTVAAGQSYRLNDLALASRLSYFLWGTYPDDELITAATQGKLSAPEEFDKQVRRMLTDSRSIWLSEKFAYEWLHLGGLLKL